MQCSTHFHPCERGRISRPDWKDQSASGVFSELCEELKNILYVDWAAVYLILVDIRGTGESGEEKWADSSKWEDKGPENSGHKAIQLKKNCVLEMAWRKGDWVRYKAMCFPEKGTKSPECVILKGKQSVLEIWDIVNIQNSLFLKVC